METARLTGKTLEGDGEEDGERKRQLEEKKLRGKNG